MNSHISDEEMLDEFLAECGMEPILTIVRERQGPPGVTGVMDQPELFASASRTRIRSIVSSNPGAWAPTTPAARMAS